MPINCLHLRRRTKSILKTIVKKFNSWIRRRTPKNFFDLPPELRNQVYRALWEQTPEIRIRGHGSSEGPVHACPTSVADGPVSIIASYAMPRWPFTRRQICEEAVQEFALRGYWIVGLAAAPYLGDITSALSPAKALRVHLNIPSAHPHKPQPDGLAPFSEDLPRFTQFLEYFSEAGKAMVLSILITVCHNDGSTKKMDFSRIASSIPANSNLTTLFITVARCSTPAPDDTFDRSCLDAITKLGTLSMGEITEPLKEVPSDRTTKFTVHRLQTSQRSPPSTVQNN